MNTVLRLSLILIYVLALLGLAVELPFGASSWLLTLTVVLFVAHALEAVVMLPRLKRYPGPLATSVILTLLFGFLHWRALPATDSASQA